MAYFNGKQVWNAKILSRESYGKGYQEGYDLGKAEGSTEGYNLGQKEGYANGYEKGHDVGHEEGYETGKNEGYDLGHGAGQAEGYAQGKVAGIEEGKQTGYQEGFSDGENVGYGNGFSVGKEEGYKDGYVAGNIDGVHEGREEGYEQGKADGVVEGIEAGKEAEWSVLWDGLQNNGNGTTSTFRGAGWTDDVFKPKYDIVFDNLCMYGFRDCSITDLKGILESRGLSLDTKNIGNFYLFFGNSKLTRIPAVDCSSASLLSQTFYNCKDLVSIDEIKWTKSNFQWQSVFYCPELVEIRFNGVIDNNISLSYSTKLSADSVESIVSCLKTYSQEDTDNFGKKTITFSRTAWNRFTDEVWLPEIFIIQYGSWENYISGIGWNLALA